MPRTTALAGGLLAVVLVTMAVVAVHAQAPAESPEPSGSASPSSAPSKAPAWAPTAMEMETLWLVPAKAPALGGKASVAGAPQEYAPAAAPAFASFENKSPEESPAGAGHIALVPAADAAPHQEYAPFMAPAFAPLGSESPEVAPAGSPELAEVPGPSSEMAAAPSSEDYDVLEEEALSPAGGGPPAEASDPATVTSSPAEAPGLASADDASGTSATTRRSLPAVVLFVAVSAVVAAF